MNKLFPQSLKAKDLRTATSAQLQHRHYAFIASIIASIADPTTKHHMAIHFKRNLTRTNHKFDGRRFLAACTITTE